MNALMNPETPQEGARRLAAKAMRDGYQPQGLHEYQAADGTPMYWRIRLKRADGSKWVRPMRQDGDAFVIGEPAFPGGKPLYKLPELTTYEKDTAFVVEGETCTDALLRLGIVATTSGSSSSADAADWTPLRGRSVTVWPDRDNPGTKYAAEVVRHLVALGCDVQLIDQKIIDTLPEHGDVVDWLEQHPEATAADVRALPTVAPAAAGELEITTAPEPLRKPTPPPAPYPVAELGPVIRPAAEAIRRVIQAPDAVCAASLLAAASLATQGLADVHMDGRVYPLSLWLLTIADSGERKSAVDAEAMRGARDVERDRYKRFDEETTQHEAAAEQWNARRDACRKECKGGAGLAAKLSELGSAPEPPLKPSLIVADFTAEGLAKLLKDGRPSVGAFTDEGGLVFGGHGMTKETVTRTAATLSKLWDRGELDRIRASEGATKLYGRRLAMHLMVQPIIAERALGDAILSGQGFLARCLLSWPNGTAGTRSYVAESLRENPALAQFTSRTSELLKRELPLAEGTRNELSLRALTLTANAKVKWVEVYNAIESAEGPNGKFAACKTWASKAAEQCLRIAGVLTLVEDPDTQLIEADTIGRAGEIALWHLHEALRLAGTAELSPEIRDAEAVLAWCHEKGLTLLHSRAALNGGRVRDRERFLLAMDALEGAGWAQRQEGGAVVDGKHRRNVWRIVPKSEED